MALQPLHVDISKHIFILLEIYLHISFLYKIFINLFLFRLFLYSFGHLFTHLLLLQTLLHNLFHLHLLHIRNLLLILRPILLSLRLSLKLNRFLFIPTLLILQSILISLRDHIFINNLLFFYIALHSNSIKLQIFQANQLLLHGI